MTDKIMTAGTTGEPLAVGTGLSVVANALTAAAATADYVGVSLTTVAAESIAAGNVVGAFQAGIRKGFGLRAVGSEDDTIGAACYGVQICSLSNTLFVVAYQKTADNKIYARAFKVNSDWTFTWGAEVAVTAVATIQFGIKIRKVNATTFAIGYAQASDLHGWCIGGTVDSTPTITLDAGGIVEFHNALTMGTLGGYSWTGFDMKLIDTNKLLFAFRDGGDSNYGHAVIATLVGSAITVDTAHEAKFSGTLVADDISIAPKTSTRAEIFYESNATTFANILVKIATTTPTFGTAYTGVNAVGAYGSEACAVTPSGQVFHAAGFYSAVGPTYYINVGLGYYYANDLSYGVATYPILSAATSGLRMVALAINQWMYLVLGVNTSSIMAYLFKGHAYGFSSEPIVSTIHAYDSDFGADLSADGKILAVAFTDSGDAHHTHVLLYDVGVPVGIAQAANSGGTSLDICVKGMSDVHSSLTPGSIYYMNTDGTLSPSLPGQGTAAFNGWVAGYAYSATQIIVQKMNTYFC